MEPGKGATWMSRVIVMALVGIVLALSLVLSRPGSHPPLVVRGAHGLAPSVRQLPTLPPG